MTFPRFYASRPTKCGGDLLMSNYTVQFELILVSVDTQQIRRLSGILVREP